MKRPSFQLDQQLLHRSPQVPTPPAFLRQGDHIRRHRNEHAVDWLTGALEMMRETGNVQQVLQHFLRLETPDVAPVTA